MSTQTYNTGRVVGWSSYEEFLKQNPEIDPSIITEQVYQTLVTYGAARILEIPMSGWRGNKILTQTIQVPGAIYGVVPIVGIYYGAALSDTSESVTQKAKLEGGIKNIFACYVSDSAGSKTTNATKASGYITFCAYPEILGTDLNTLSVIVRGLGAEALNDGHAYLGPCGLMFGGNGLNQSYSFSMQEFQLASSNSSGYYNQIHDANLRIPIYDTDGGVSGYTSDCVALSMADNQGNLYDLSGSNTSNITIPFSKATSTASKTDYVGYLSWNDLVRMLVEEKKAKMTIPVEKYQVSGATYTDVTPAFLNSTHNAPVNFIVGWGSYGSSEANKKNVNLLPWDQTTSLSNCSCAGFYRVFLRLYPSDFSMASRFDLVVGAYLKNDVYVQSPSPTNEVFRADGLLWRADSSDSRRALFSQSNTGIAYGFQESDPIVYKWDTVPETISKSFNGKKFTADTSNWGWGVSVTVNGHGVVGNNNDVLYLSDRSFSYSEAGAPSTLEVFMGTAQTADSGSEGHTWKAATSMAEAQWSFAHSCSGVYILD